MRAYESIAIAMDSLRSHKLRSFLTLLGIIIATATLIFVIAVVKGLDSYIAERFANLGSNAFVIARFPIITDFDDYVKAARRNRPISVDDYQIVKERLTLAREVGLQAQTRRDVRYGSQLLTDVSIQGVTANTINIGNLQVESGRYFSEADDVHRAAVGFIGRDIAERLFPSVDPIGKVLLVDGRPFEVVGVAKPIGSVFGESQDKFVSIPVRTFVKMHGEHLDMWINVAAASPALLEQAQDQARVIMRALRHPPPLDPDRFGVIASSSIMTAWDNIFGAIGNATIGVVAVFLVVGGVVIMNIMLATVTERTREIGLRKSLGARRRDILLQFLVESSSLAAVGGTMGVLLAFGLSFLASSGFSLPTRTPLWAVATGVLLSTAVGLFFGIYPANKAAKLDPVEALRVEG
jgi:putative ABC transport system permease protein